MNSQQKQQIWRNLKRAVLEQMIVIPPAIPQEDPLLKELRRYPDIQANIDKQ